MVGTKYVSINSSNFHPCFEKENIVLRQGTHLGNQQGSVFGQAESPGPCTLVSPQGR